MLGEIFTIRGYSFDARILIWDRHLLGMRKHLVWGQCVSEVQYPISDQYKVLEGHDLYRSSRLIVALVAVESKYGKDLRLYRWQKRLDRKTQQESWKVDLARMSVKGWDWEKLATKARELKAKYSIKGQGVSETEQT